jgi:hypothetical protein
MNFRKELRNKYFIRAQVKCFEHKPVSRLIWMFSSVVGVVATLWSKLSGVQNLSGARGFLYLLNAQLALWSTQASIQRVQWTKWPRRYAER